MNNKVEKMQLASKWLARSWYLVVATASVIGCEWVLFPGESRHIVGQRDLIVIIAVFALAAAVAFLPLLIVASLLEFVASRHMTGGYRSRTSTKVK